MKKKAFYKTKSDLLNKEKNYLVVFLIGCETKTVGTVAFTEEEARSKVKAHYNNNSLIFVSVEEYEVI